MVAYTKKSKALGELLQAQGFAVLSVTDIGRGFTVEFAPETTEADLGRIDFGKRSLRLGRAKADTNLYGKAVLRADFAPFI